MSRSTVTSTTRPAPGKRTLVQPRGLPTRRSSPPTPDATQAAAESGVAGDISDYPHRAAIEGAFGMRVAAHAHVDAPAQEACAVIGATAFATGNDVAFATPNPDLHTATH